MTREEFERVPAERKQRFVDAVMDFKRRCFLCGENLTFAERQQDRTACEDCWPDENEGGLDE